MRRPLRRTLVAALSAVVGAALAVDTVACAPFGTAATDTESSIDGAAPTADGAVVDDATTAIGLDGTPPLIDGAVPPGPGTCFDFTVAEHGVTKTNAQRGPDGFTLEIGPGQTSSIRKSFTAPGDTKITKSVVTIIAAHSLDDAAKWGADAYVDVMAQYLGDTTSYEDAPAMTLELLQPRLELNVWHAANTFDKTYLLEVPIPPSAPPRPLALDTDWRDGATAFTLGPLKLGLVTKKTTAETTRLTVVIGGAAHGTTPKLQLVVKMLCVALQ